MPDSPFPMDNLPFWFGVQPIDIQPIEVKPTSGCRYKHRVRVCALPNSSIDEEGQKRKIRQYVSRDLRFAKAWPHCTVHDKTISLQYEVDADLDQIVGYFKCLDCAEQGQQTWI